MKKKHILLKILMIFILIIAIIGYLGTSKSEYMALQTEKVSSKNMIHVVQNAIMNKGIVELSGNDINSVVQPFIDDEIQNDEIKNDKNKKEDFEVNGFAIDIKDSDIITYLPVKYKNLEVVLSTKGKIKYGKGYVIYFPKNFRIGKLILPKNFIMSLLERNLKNERLIIDDNSIAVNIKELPIKIDDIRLENSKLIVSSKETYEKLKLLKNLSKNTSEITANINKNISETNKTENEKQYNSVSSKNNNLASESSNNVNSSNGMNSSNSVNTSNINEPNNNIGNNNSNSSDYVNKSGNTNNNSNNDDNNDSNGDSNNNSNVNNNNGSSNRNINSSENENNTEIKSNINTKNSVDTENSADTKNETDTKNSIDSIGSETGQENNQKNTIKTENTQYELSIVKNDLIKVKNSVTTKEEKQIVDIVYSVVNKLMIDPKYDFTNDALKVISIYNTLSPEDKKSFKNIVFSKVNLDNALKLNEMFNK